VSHPGSPFQASADALRALDERLAHAIDLVGPCLLVPAKRSPYESLLSAIAHQQVHGAAAAAILGRMQRLYSPAGRWPTPDELLATPEDALRGAGLSRSKVLAMRDVAARTLDGTVPDGRTIARLDDAAIIHRLVAVRGVGRWTAEMLLIFTLGRPDVLPVDDFGVRYGFTLLYGKRRMPKPKWLAKYGERWAPHRSTASWYLWRYVDRIRADGLDPARKRTKKKGAKAAAKTVTKTSTTRVAHRSTNRPAGNAGRRPTARATKSPPAPAVPRRAAVRRSR
jgi:DNA-3-methyladenine glycosylase II